MLRIRLREVALFCPVFLCAVTGEFVAAQFESGNTDKSAIEISNRNHAELATGLGDHGREGDASLLLSPEESPMEREAEMAPGGLRLNGGPNSRTGLASLDQPSIWKIAGSLTVVLAAFLALAWLLRKSLPQGPRPLPDEVVKLLGRTILTARQQAYLLKFGNKLLLLSVSPTGVDSIAELTDPDEVNRIEGICEQARPNSSSQSFRQTLRQLSSDKSDVVPGRTPVRMQHRESTKQAPAFPGVRHVQ